MPRSFRGVGYENFLVSRRGVPENFGHIPRPVGVVNEQAVPERLQLAVSANDRFGGRALHKRAGFGIEDGAEEIVGRRIADFKSDGRVELCQLHQIRPAKLSSLWRWLRGPRFFH